MEWVLDLGDVWNGDLGGVCVSKWVESVGVVSRSAERGMISSSHAIGSITITSSTGGGGVTGGDWESDGKEWDCVSVCDGGGGELGRGGAGDWRGDCRWDKKSLEKSVNGFTLHLYL